MTELGSYRKNPFSLCCHTWQFTLEIRRYIGYLWQKYLVRLDRHSMCVLPGKSMIWRPVGSSLKRISSHVQVCSISLYRNRHTDNCSIASCIAGSTSYIAVTFSWMPESPSWTVVMFPVMSGSNLWISVISFVIPGNAPIIVVTLRVASRIAGSSYKIEMDGM